MHPVLMELLPYVKEGYCCSQLLTLLVLQAQGKENQDLVRATHGLCMGLGFSNGPCGLLTGGATALGLLAGHGDADSPAHPAFMPLINEYATWFYEYTAQYGGYTCDTITSNLGNRNSAASDEQDIDLLACGTLLGACWEKIIELADSYTIDIQG